MTPLMPMRAALKHKDVFGSILPGESWAAWRILLIALCGERLTDSERETFKALTGREMEPGKRVEEFWAVIGRRGGKTRAVSILAAYIASLIDFSDVLAPGERASLSIMSASLWQAKNCFQYLEGIFTGVPALSKLVINWTADTISLSTRVDIECRPASFRTSRGGTACAVLADELAFWRSETSANPDSEILAAVRPSLVTTGGMLVCISSPYAKRGELYNAFKRDYGPDGDSAILVAKATSREMNPLLSEKTISRAYERDAAAASAEFGAEFRSDIETVIAREVVEAAVIPGRFEIPYIAGTRYVAFVDPSGGSSDSMTLAIAHCEGDMIILDAIREACPPFSPENIVAEFVILLRSYGIYEISGDRYAGEWPREQFRKYGITYKVSERPKSDIYRDVLPLLNSGRVELLDDKRLVTQFCNLERKTARGGRDSIDHAVGAHDDVANSVSGVLASAVVPRNRMIVEPLVM